MGKKCQPWLSMVASHADVRLACAQARFTPPMYTPTDRYLEASQLVMVDTDGAAQASNPRPLTTPCGGTAVIAAGPRSSAGPAVEPTVIDAWMASASARSAR